MTRWILYLACLPLALFSQELLKSPAQVQAELNDAQAQFQQAQKLFNPWYTGPLITPSASMMPPGIINYQPYVNVRTNYAVFNGKRHSISTPNEVQLQSQNIFQTGITNWMDVILFLQGSENWLQNKNGGGFGDIAITVGWPLFLQTLYIPQFKLTVQQTFPSGRYKNLSSTGLLLEGVGGGSYVTQFGLAISKVLFWATQHPMNTRLFLGYSVPTTVHVTNFNSYGGGFGTAGKVRPGNSFSADLGLEVSINQPWVAALDIVYTYANHATFQGYRGLTAAGLPAPVGNGSNDNLSLAPAFEYNWNSNLGIIFGAQFSVYGRNSANFATGLFSVTWTFQPSTKF